MPDKRPNILLITTDTQRTDTLHCMGSPFAFSPNIDRLAREGTMFTRAYTASPACMPARCSILSGLHTPLHGCTENGVMRYADMPVFTDALKQLGYHTIMVGKTHFGTIPESFDIRETVKGEKNQIREDDFTELFRRAGWPENSGWPNPVPEKYCLDSFITDRALYHISRAKEGRQPFFLFCSLLSPHSPLDPPGRWSGFYKGGDLPFPHFRSGEWQSLPRELKKLCGIPRGKVSEDWIDRMVEGKGNIADTADEEEIREYKALYYSSAAYCDSLVGRLIDYLNEQNMRESTLIIFTSDHGQQYFDHGFNDKHNYYEETWRVPLLMSLPGILPQGKKSGFASGTDLAPTIVGAAGGKYETANGFDLFTPLAEGKKNPRICAAASIQRSMAVVTKDWKLEYYMDDGETRLFHLKDDSHEDCDVSAEARYAVIRSGLENALLLWRASMVNPADLRKRISDGGPVAKRAAGILRTIEGNECEKRLADKVKEILMAD